MQNKDHFWYTVSLKINNLQGRPSLPELQAQLEAISQAEGRIQLNYGEAGDLVLKMEYLDDLIDLAENG